jgi:hypothetical protein
LSHTSLVTITITLTHVIAITIAIALLVTVNRLPPSLPLLLPPKPSLSSLHPTIVANVIARSIPLTLFVTHHPYPHRHRLSALTLFVTCSHRYLIVFFHLYCRLGGEPTGVPTRDDLMVDNAGTKTSYYSSGGALVASRRPPLQRLVMVGCCVLC